MYSFHLMPWEWDQLTVAQAEGLKRSIDKLREDTAKADRESRH